MQQLQRFWAWYRNLFRQQSTLLGKLIVIGLLGFLPCLCCVGLVGILPSAPRTGTNALATADARLIQETAEAISTENAQVIATLTATHRDGGNALQVEATAAPTALTEPSATDIPITSTPFVLEAPSDTPTIFYKVITNTPVNTRLATRRPATPRPLTALPPTESASPPPTAVGVTEGCPNGCTELKAGCAIKGNVSTRNGNQKIYHVPGERDYDKTQVNIGEGDRWFCTTAEAEANGFRAPLR